MFAGSQINYSLFIYAHRWS